MKFTVKHEGCNEVKTILQALTAFSRLTRENEELKRELENYRKSWNDNNSVIKRIMELADANVSAELGHLEKFKELAKRLGFIDKQQSERMREALEKIKQDLERVNNEVKIQKFGKIKICDRSALQISCSYDLAQQALSTKEE